VGYSSIFGGTFARFTELLADDHSCKGAPFGRGTLRSFSTDNLLVHKPQESPHFFFPTFATMASTSGERMTKEDFRKRKELEEARKAGTAPAEVDEDGNAINPHIPQYIAQAPWYLYNNRPSLKHQRSSLQKGPVDHDWYIRGAKAVCERKITKH
jgi:hypothetical protein